jgi:UDP-N-acetylglucosamine--N-acetylmuramyl-(pentapeptide) pyrophosphoryl-undecaprenol N-acetylglucosamine transferase
MTLPSNRSDPPRTRPRDEEPGRRRIAIAGGYTAGHVNTGLEIARAYQNAVDATSVLFIGTPSGFEERLVTSTEHHLAIIPAAPIATRGPLGKLHGAWSACLGYLEARRLLKAERIELVVGLGSFASGVVLLAAHHLGIRTVLHEANARMGLANRIAARFADRIYLDSPSALEGTRYFGDGSSPANASGRPRIVVTGNPVRPEVASGSGHSTAPPSHRPTRILVMGGSRGSPFLNKHAPELLAHLAAHGIDLEVHHQAGDADIAPIRSEYARLGIEAVVLPYFDDIVAQYSGAHFVVTSAGAICLAEIAACGLPSLVVPLAGAAHDHQVHNAIAYSRHCGALWSRESTWNSRDLAAEIASQLGDPTLWTEYSQRAQKLSRPDAARKLVEDCETLMGADRR